MPWVDESFSPDVALAELSDWAGKTLQVQLAMSKDVWRTRTIDMRKMNRAVEGRRTYRNVLTDL